MPVLWLLALGAACSALASLGFWQLDRAQQKSARIALYRERQAAAPLDFNSILAPAENHLWRRVALRGHFIDRHMLLDNRIQAGRAGYQVLTLFALDDGRVALVNRGFMASSGDRSALPELVAPADPTVATGFIGPPPAPGIALGQLHAELLAPHVIRVQAVDPRGLAELFAMQVWPQLIYLDGDHAAALAVDWAPPGDGSAKHRAYALQWFAMAAVLGAIGLWNLYGRRHSAR
jgi:cytochrome oxidase assembly protein ShyY1